MIYERVENTRWLFYCNRCIIGRIIDEPNLDLAYLAYLELYDADEITSISIDDILVNEGLIRSKAEVDELLNGINDKLMHDILYTKKDYVVYYKLLDEEEPEFGIAIDELEIDDMLKDALKKNGIDRLYKFQEEAISDIIDGKDVVIVAPTASGKTEAFTIPILECIKDSHALFVYPTKALARDQASKIREYANALGIRIAILDGDTPQDERRYIINSKPQIILTNFDTLHYHLMHRTDLVTLLKNIRYLIIDEVHIYTGIFGSHIHYIIKRLGRFSRFQIIAASATLPNAKEFCERLFDRKVKIVEGKGKRGKIHFAMLYPTLRTQRALMLDLLKKLANKHKTLVFSDSHLSAELLAYYGYRQGIKIKVHRAGLSQTYRNAVEDQFKKGELMALSATPTLELGIDIGDLDAIISSKIPINRLYQRLGRAARKQQTGYAFLAFGNDPISQYYKNHPEDYLSDFEYAYIDPYNPTVQEYQLLAMICDKPLPDTYYDEYAKVIDELLEKQLIKHVSNRYIANYRTAIKLLHEINIRGSGKSIDIYVNKKRVGERTLPIALEELHNDAVYFLAGKRYRVDQLDLDKYKAYLS
ncbi:MAG: DEAD/DEAH box helicase, partial [Candidatus Nitrosothermus koennekii]